MIDDFINHIVKLAEDGIKQLTNPKSGLFSPDRSLRPMNPLTFDQQYNFENSTHCHICTKELNPYIYRKV